MGLWLSPEFDTTFTGADAFAKHTDGKDLLHAFDLFDRICNEKRVTPFRTFAPDFEALATELKPGEKLDGIWFDCADGLRTISALIRALATDKQWAKGLPKYLKIDGLVADLRLLEKDLKIGKKHKARFYILMC